MFGLLKRMFTVKKDDLWDIGTGSDQGKPLIFRMRKTVPNWCDKSIYRHLVCISWPFDSETGMPGADVNKLQIKLEDRLDECIEVNKNGILMIVVTGNGVKEWQYYCKDTADFMNDLNAGLNGLGKLPIEISGQEDGDWLAYINIVNLFKTK